VPLSAAAYQSRCISETRHSGIELIRIAVPVIVPTHYGRRVRVAAVSLTGSEIGTLTTRMDGGGAIPNDNSASIRGDVRNRRENFFMVISLVTRSHAALFARRYGVRCIVRL
jgi:hypothetical protein